jgi:CheY-specific phosphatase CheX
MPESLKQLLAATVAEVYETMFFTPLESAEDSGYEPDREQPVFIEAVIGLTAEETGEIRFYYVEPLARHIGVNFLGIDDEALDERRMCDTLGEAANMTVGSLLGKLDSQAVCGTLSIPTVNQPEGLHVGDLLERPDTMVFHTDFGPLLLDYGALNKCFQKQ